MSFKLFLWERVFCPFIQNTAFPSIELKLPLTRLVVQPVELALLCIYSSVVICFNQSVDDCISVGLLITTYSQTQAIKINYTQHWTQYWNLRNPARYAAAPVPVNLHCFHAKSHNKPVEHFLTLPVSAFLSGHWWGTSRKSYWNIDKIYHRFNSCVPPQLLHYKRIEE